MEILNAFKHLRDREKDVFAYLLLFNNKMKEQPLEIRDKLLLDYDIKLQIKEALNLKDDNFNCIIHTLRQKGVLKDRRINPLYEVYPEFPFEMTFKFVINETV
jgi:hypothetical protein